MNALQNFNFNNQPVRIVMIDDTPWWVLSDVCGVLEIGNPSMISCLDNDEVRTLRITEGGPERKIVNESGLYTVIMRSSKPNAKAFRKWVTSEVLPQIRKTGSYSVQLQSQAVYPSDPHDQVIALCDKLKSMALEAKQLTQKIEEQAPKVALADACIVADNLLTLTQVSKMLNVHRNLFCDYLRKFKVLYLHRGENVPFDRYIDAGYFSTKNRSIPHSDGFENHTQTLVTGKGVQYLQNIVKNLPADSPIRNKSARKTEVAA